MKFGSILFAGLALLLPGVAHAQYDMVQPLLYHGPEISFRAHVAQQEAARTARQSGDAPAEAATAPVDMATMRFRPDIARRRSNLAQFVAKSRAADPAGAQSLETLFAQGDIIERIGGELRKKDLRTDNVADTYAVWWITAWLGSRGRTDDVSPATIRAVRDQAAQALGSTGQFTGAGDPAKQEMAESLLIQSLLIEAAVEQAQTDPAKLRDVGAAVRQGAKGMGLDLDQMNLTEAGFVPA
jgi:hypothetical protein